MAAIKSIEEKAKRYDDAIERAKDFMTGKVHYALKKGENIMCWIFPELRESENERIRKDIIWCLKHSGLKDDNPINPHVTTTTKEAIAWLEKQGEQKPQRMVSAEAKEAMYNKPAWSEEDENLFRCAIDAVKQESKVRTNGCLDEEVGEMVINWLKSLKDRVLPKQEWSEEDEKFLDGIIANLEYLVDRANTDTLKQSLQKRIDWLKSLRPQKQDVMSEDEFRHVVGYLVQDIVANEHMAETEKQPTKFFVEKYYKKLKPQNTWKPSEEQIDALEDAIADAISSIQKNMLNSLYSDLKKL